MAMARGEDPGVELPPLAGWNGAAGSAVVGSAA